MVVKWIRQIGVTCFKMWICRFETKLLSLILCTFSVRGITVSHRFTTEVIDFSVWIFLWTYLAFGSLFTCMSLFSLVWELPSGIPSLTVEGRWLMVKIPVTVLLLPMMTQNSMLINERVRTRLHSLQIQSDSGGGFHSKLKCWKTFGMRRPFFMIGKWYFDFELIEWKANWNQAWRM